MNQPGHRILPLVALVLALAAVTACVVGTFSVRGTQLTVVGRSDTVRGDEPYLGAIRFRSAFGVANSTTVEVYGNLKTLGDQVRPGHSVSVPETDGLWDFGTGVVLSESDVVTDGRSPGVGGVIIVAMEEDHGGKTQVRKTLGDTATQLEALLLTHVEQSRWSNLALPLALKAVSDGLQTGDGDGKCGLTDSRFCNFFKSRLGDDFIGRAITIFVGVDDAYFQKLLPTWRSAASLGNVTWPECEDTANPICPMRSMSQVLDLDAPSDGLYRLRVDSTFVAQ